MVNFLIQYSKNKHDFTDDKTHSSMNHYNYKHFRFRNQNLRIDFLQHRQDTETRFLSDDDAVIFYLGNILFKNEDYNTVKQLKKLYLNDKSIVNEIESGRFILVIYDKKKDKLTIINDRFGLIPYFIYEDEKNFIFSTEPKGILRSNPLEQKKFNLDYAAVANYFKYGYILGDKYLVKEILKQKNSQILTFHNATIKSRQYWYCDPSFDKKINSKILDELLETFRAGLEKNKKKYPGNYTCDISGGYDCRFIYLNDPDVNHVMTVGDKDYSYVIDTLKLKPAKLLHVKSKLTEEKIIKLLDLTDLSGTIGGHAVIDVIDNYQKYDISFQYGYNGFLGDAILGGEYLNNKKEVLREFKIYKPYSYNDFDINDFNDKLLNKTFLEKLNNTNDFNNYIDKKKIKGKSDKDLRKQLVFFKMFNRGLNQINANGSLLGYKYMNKFFPFFYYPFFDLYTTIDLDDLCLRKTYTNLFKKIDQKYHVLKDEHFKIAFSFPFSFRLITRMFYSLFSKQKLIRTNNKKIQNPSKDILDDKLLIQFFKEILTSTESQQFFDKKYLSVMFNDFMSIEKNYRYLNRCIGFALFLKKFDNVHH